MNTTHTPPTERRVYGYICMECSFYTSSPGQSKALSEVEAHCHQTQHVVKAGEDV